MRLLVTGGAGYVGSVVVETLAAAGHCVTVFDNLSQGHRCAVDPEATLIVGDLLDIQAIDAAIQQSQPEAVLHFAARTIVSESVAKPLVYLRQNVVGTLNLLESMSSHAVNKLVFSSTAGLYCTNAVDQPIDENDTIQPTSPYAESKYIVERMLQWHAIGSGIHYAVLRYFNAAGATMRCGEDHYPETHLIPLALQTAQGHHDRLTICGTDYPTQDGTCIRDYIHVSDLADAHVLALKSLGTGNCVYNLGNGTGYSVAEVIDACRRVTNLPIPVVHGPRRNGDPPMLVACNDRIRRDLGWQPRFTNIDEIIQTAWDWLESHPGGYRQSYWPDNERRLRSHKTGSKNQTDPDSCDFRPARALGL